MIARNVMSPAPLTVTPETRVAAAISKMAEARVSGLPIVDEGGEVVGMLTEGDLLRRSETGTEKHRSRWLEVLFGSSHSAAEYVRTHSQRVGDLMMGNVVTVAEDTPLEEVVSIMERENIKRVPVLRDRKLTGMISRFDLLRALAGALQPRGVPEAGDEAIHKALLSELDDKDWFRPRDISITVKDGVVTLSGVALDSLIRTALRVAAENIPGVNKVENEIQTLEPVVGFSIG
ncbi:MAG: CBS domain-containing protein [Acetobacteraceae bacterium]|nr:CBS domain-containing protein [Acetobacteraceae bacterium]MBV8523188.1 CBS domain-containing protein [Acetobacteraceae bacterium]MBV8591600.1 CBS domain-containing protein [Acetobacteraceae bacterium]